MSGRHSSTCCKLNPDLGARDSYNSTWMVCKIEKEFSSYLSLCIFNEYENEENGAYHVEGKFLDFWEKEPTRIFPDLPTNSFDRKAFDLIWYMPRSPCYECTKLIIKNCKLFKSLTILTASVYQLADEDDTFARKRVEMLRKKDIMVEPMSFEEYEYFTSGRVGHQLPADESVDPEEGFTGRGIPIASRDAEFLFLPIANIRSDWKETSSRGRGSRGRKSYAESAAWAGNRRTIPKKYDSYRGTGRYNSGHRGGKRYQPY